MVFLLPVSLYVCVCGYLLVDKDVNMHVCVHGMFGGPRPRAGATLQLSSTSLLRCGLSLKIKLTNSARVAG